MTAVSLGAVALGCGGSTARPERPNIVLIVVDTLRADRLGCYGASRATSPSVDALARRGVLFRRAYATAPWTAPSIASILTGLHPSTHGLQTVRQGLRPELDTLAEILGAHGYATHALVSHAMLAARRRFDQGFDSYDDSEAGGHEYVSTGGVTRKAIGRLEALAAAGDAAPFFLFVHYFDPHFRYFAHPEYGFAAVSEGRLMGAEPIGWLRAASLTESEVGFLRDLYDEEVRYTDAGIGRLLGRLAELGLEDRTVVVVTADHGEAFGDHGWLGHTRDLYEELIRVPLVVRVPWAPGDRSLDGPVSLTSLAPTLLELAGVDAGELRFQGPSLAARIVSGSPAPAEGALVLSEVDFEPISAHYDDKRSRRKAIVGARFKLIRDDETGALALYDLGADPGETRDVARDHPRTTRDLAALLDERLGELRARSGVAERFRLRQDEVEQLDALGYGAGGSPAVPLR